MVWITGTASGFDDLWVRVRDHLLNDSTLTSAGEAWSEAWASGNASGLTAPGFGGYSSVNVIIERVADPANNIYEWRVSCADELVGTAATWAEHRNVSPRVRILLADMSMPYWLAANGHRFVLVVKVSNQHEPLYAGCFLPYATPAEYPKPFLVGGAAGMKERSYDPERWNDSAQGHRAFVYSWHDSYTTASAYVRAPDGVWGRLQQNDYNAWGDPQWALWPTSSGFIAGSGGWFDTTETANYRLTSDQMLRHLRPSPGGQQPLFPYVIMSRQAAPPGQVLGELDGVFRIPTYGNSAESIITSGSDSYIVFANITRQDDDDLWALKQE